MSWTFRGEPGGIGNRAMEGALDYWLEPPDEDSDSGDDEHEDTSDGLCIGSIWSGCQREFGGIWW